MKQMMHLIENALLKVILLLFTVYSRLLALKPAKEIEAGRRTRWRNDVKGESYIMNTVSRSSLI